MTKEIYISSTPHETRLAVVEDDQLAEIYYERENEYTLAGSVYKGKVTRVLPGMQSAFVDIGLERDAFLYVTDFAEEQEDGEEYVPLTQNQSQGNGRKAAPAGDSSQNGAQKARSDNTPRTDATQSTSGGDSGSRQSDNSESGSRRWRGRRGRRRGRGNAPQNERPSQAEGTAEEHNVAPAGHSEQAIEFELGEIGDPGIEPEFLPQQSHADHSAAPQSSESGHARQNQAAQNQPLVLPGESLSKYRRGQAPSKSSEPTSPSAGMGPAATVTSTAPSFQPSTMVVAPLEWDGSELLPGESISRYKNKPAHSTPTAQPTAIQPAEPQEHSAFVASPAAEAGTSVEEDFVPAVEHANLEAPEETIPAATETTSTAPIVPELPQHNLTPVPAEHELRQHPLTQHPIGHREVERTGIATGHTAIPSQATPEVAGDSSNLQSQDFEPTEASASYRFDPSTPSAYRQSSVAEPPTESETAHIPETPAEHAVDEHTPEPAPPSEPFFGESVTIAQPHPAPAQDAPSQPDENEETVEEEASEDDNGTHVFDPGHGNLEEEIIDEEEPEAYALHGQLEEEEYDDLVEETLDMQMDSGLLGDVVRDRHIEQRTRFVGEPGEAPGTEESFDGEEDAFEEAADVELEELAEEESDEEDSSEGSNADAARIRTTQPGNRRGVRGQRQGHGGNRGRMRRSTAQTTNLPAITELLKPNQEILVQIAKEPIARKGARITSHIALPGRFLVFMPTVNHVGVSRKISSDEERQRLKHILLSEKGAASGGFIVRTAAATASEEDLRADIRFLLTLWAEIRQRADNSKPPALIYHDLSLVERVLRDQVTDNFSAIWVDSEQDYERVLRFLNRFEPSLVRRVKLYTKEMPLFEQFGIQEEINKALRSKVWLKSGGSIVINQTEALVAIDINTGKYVGKTARLEDTILKTNLDAIPEIVRQIRLRDLGGIIVIDFIDMDERKNRNKVMVALEEELKSDRAPSKVLQFNDFGLVAITRKRVKQSLERTLSVPCSICTGTGMVKGPLTVCNEIYVELRKMHRQIDRSDVLLRVNPEVVKQLKASNGRWLSEMEEMSGKTVIVKSDATLHPEQFDIH